MLFIVYNVGMLITAYVISFVTFYKYVTNSVRLLQRTEMVQYERIPVNPYNHN